MREHAHGERGGRAAREAGEGVALGGRERAGVLLEGTR
jgi:hypothetical protein